MILTAASRALADLFAPEVRGVFWKVLGLTLLALAALWLGLREIFMDVIMPWVTPYLPDLPAWAGWLTFIAGLFAALGLAAALAMLIAPISAIVAGFFLDDAAEIIEKRDYPNEAPGVALPLGQSIWSSVQFFLVVLAANILALFLLLVPGVNLVIFFVVNGYLIGREYFEFAASRHLGVEGARQFRRNNRGAVMLAGLMVALFLFIPILNLLTPLFAAATMIHLHKSLRATSPVVR
ncbi:CysZ protein [Rhizobium sp. SG_E_25_P2]|uniref:sulfate transporter family protein n=1 Tax=Rhizobium sp. SG_E_25_P2 TaxID=2879942 RepID=UPI002474A142|nr:sulfate transporter family protein [Rhizobium sp. SG_E_25_P2]MDH6264764.1 CysZ protein [Rhizobium sp. SG_E_25_P2]